MYRRTAKLGKVDYRGQRRLIIDALMIANVPELFTAADVEKAINTDLYKQTLKDGKMKFTVLESVVFHLRELSRLGQIDSVKFPGLRVRTAAAGSEAPGEAGPSGMQLMTEWHNWLPTCAPFLLEGDAPAVNALSNTCCHLNWSEAIVDDGFGRPGDIRFHVGLLPQPFLGDLRRASVYILSLNPGLDPTDYFGESRVPEYRNALLANLKQQFDSNRLPFVFLDPQYSWHGGFRWWHRKLAQVIGVIADGCGISFAAARARLGSQLASLELVPYHSSTFGASSEWVKSLRSVALAKSFVRDFIVPRVQSGEAILIAMRGIRHWDLPDIPGVFQYEARHARGAHLTPDTDGGKAILTRLGLSGF
jgi:hypothetical protein